MSQFNIHPCPARVPSPGGLSTLCYPSTRILADPRALNSTTQVLCKGGERAFPLIFMLENEPEYPVHLISSDTGMLGEVVTLK